MNSAPLNAAVHRWPARLWLIRHGQSAGNVARDLAHEGGHAQIDIEGRDVDVPLSPLGEAQARAVGKWFARGTTEDRPQIVLSSPYRRAVDTAELIRRAGGVDADVPVRISDERLREREFGILDRLTRVGIEKRFPEQAEFREVLGKFYHRPPGGESWCDVILRLRSLLDTLSLHYAGQRVLIVTHEVVVLCLRYLFEDLDEARILGIDSHGDVANCGITEYVLDPDSPTPAGQLRLVRYNFTAALEGEGAPVTTEPDRKKPRPDL